MSQLLNHTQIWLRCPLPSPGPAGEGAGHSSLQNAPHLSLGRVSPDQAEQEGKGQAEGRSKGSESEPSLSEGPFWSQRKPIYTTTPPPQEMPWQPMGRVTWQMVSRREPGPGPLLQGHKEASLTKPNQSQANETSPPLKIHFSSLIRYPFFQCKPIKASPRSRFIKGNERENA